MDTLYHYCSSRTFASIISKKTIWLSSLSLSNDSMEGRLVSHTFERLLSKVKISESELRHVRQALKFAEEVFDGLGFCLSRNPDQLSQWRGYADDGQGFSIGFSKQYLEQLGGTAKKNELGFLVGKVLYEPTEHENALQVTFDAIKELVDTGRLKSPPLSLSTLVNPDKTKSKNKEYERAIKELWLKTIMVYRSLYLLKTKAFFEEEEWRLISYLTKALDEKFSFRAADNRIIPYREIVLTPLNTPAITDVYLGPKNITPIFVIEKALNASGFTDVNVKRSSGTYR